MTIAGKCCESGDKLIEEAFIAHPEEGDIIATFCTGAYSYSMSSNYNRLPRPAVVFVENGMNINLSYVGETYEDITRLDIPLQRVKARRKSLRKRNLILFLGILVICCYLGSRFTGTLLHLLLIHDNNL